MRPLKILFQRLVNKAGYQISKRNKPEELSQEYADQKKLISHSAVTIFDVGAHQGQTSATYHHLFPGATIYAFEPFPASFAVLKRSTAADKNIQAFNTSLGNFTGKTFFHVNASSQTNSILATDTGSEDTWGGNLLDTIQQIEIDSITVDDFVKTHSIEAIDILKLDTQGTEYQIIEGAALTIAANKIKMIYMEIIIMPTYKEQKQLDEILLLLRKNNFLLYNFYNYSYTQKGELRQVDGIFLHKNFSPSGS